MARKNQFPARKFTRTHASCSKCNTSKPFDEFHMDNSNPLGVCYWCKICANRLARKHHKNNRSNNPEYKLYARGKYTKNKYGLTLEQYTEKLATQKNECAICLVKLQSSGSKTHLDHDHKTGQIRAFLCTNCNRGLGHFKEDLNILNKAIQYLRSHSSDVAAYKEVLN